MFSDFSKKMKKYFKRWFPLICSARYASKNRPKLPYAVDKIVFMLAFWIKLMPPWHNPTVKIDKVASLTELIQTFPGMFSDFAKKMKIIFAGRIVGGFLGGSDGVGLSRITLPYDKNETEKTLT